MQSGNKGQRLYKCDDCGSRSYFHWKEFERAGKPRCPGCGCTRLEPCSKDARDEIVRKQQVRVAGGTGSIKSPGKVQGSADKVT
jgi:DNA-directed RNA polymerase subunit RPC12/RpoP